jgi:uncharacterized protein
MKSSKLWRKEDRLKTIWWPDWEKGKLMRVSKKEIRDQEVIIDLLTRCPVGRLGTIGRDGYPRIKPLNYVYRAGSIYFHSAREGEKIEDLNRDSRVCFEADLPITYVKSRGLPCQADFLYRSILIRGKARIIEDRDEKLSALKGLMEKYQPGGGYGSVPEERLAITVVIRIDIETITGKEDLGKSHEREAVLKFLAERESGFVDLDLQR